MNKIIATLVFSLTTSAYAASVTGEYQSERNDTTGKDSSVYALTVKGSVGSGFFVDIGGTTSVQETTNNLTQRLEAGLTYEPVKWLYVRGALGEKFTNTTKNSYYSVEPGVKVPLIGNLNAKVGYRYRNAIDATQYDTQLERTYRAGLSYDVNKTSTVGVGYDKTEGDVEKKIWRVNYSYNF